MIFMVMVQTRSVNGKKLIDKEAEEMKDDN